MLCAIYLNIQKTLYEKSSSWWSAQTAPSNWCVKIQMSSVCSSLSHIELKIFALTNDHTFVHLIRSVYAYSYWASVLLLVVTTIAVPMTYSVPCQENNHFLSCLQHHDLLGIMIVVVVFYWVGSIWLSSSVVMCDVWCVMCDFFKFFRCYPIPHQVVWGFLSSFVVI